MLDTLFSDTLGKSEALSFLIGGMMGFAFSKPRQFQKRQAIARQKLFGALIFGVLFCFISLFSSIGIVIGAVILVFYFAAHDQNQNNIIYSIFGDLPMALIDLYFLDYIE